MSDSLNQQALLTYQDGGSKNIEIIVSNESVWITQKNLAEIFGVNVPAISKHISNIFEEGELDENSVVSILEITASDGKKYKTAHYHLVSPADFQEMLNELSSITALELEYTSLRVEQPTYAQLSQYVKRESHKIVFNRQFTAGSGLIRAIMSLVETDKPDSGKVTGSDESGIERVIRIDNNPYTFGEFDFDEIVEKIHQLNIKEFHQSWVISKLLSTCREQSELFETEAQ